ncbi:peptidase M16 domain protein [Methylocella silvestris BL2]|uniref:Peptidase M16 domain protein n=1 Tax=Methylocella silvestris (strain DSM 15510 / CIP 108128 / LMG 27833 / NCIMB 13906 / BL2) TaxID=395965 RepID=B8ETD9_METSB|nr:pitrilysin family protein [Methylocella silvestris]ACK51781.1 peptidase M16 domain protein [Methylocella silvestris BL2]
MTPTAALETPAPLKPAESRSRAAQVQKIVSSGGVEAWLVEDYAVPLVAVEFAFKGGASQDPAGKPGTANLLSGLLDEGAGPYDAEGFHRALDEDAIELSFSADRDNFHGRLQTLSRNVAPAFSLMRLAVNEARLDDEPFKRVSSQIAASLKREVNDPDHVASRAFREKAYLGHPYGRPVRGDLDVLPTLTRDDLVDLRTAVFARETLKIAVVGAIDAEALKRHLDDVFGALPQAAGLIATPEAEFSSLGQRFVVDVDVPQSTIRFGRPGLAQRDPDFFAGMVVNHVLGGGVFSARLFREVREKRGLAYSVYSQLLNYDHGAMLYGGTSTKNERAAESMAVIEAEIRNLSEVGPTEEELDKAKKYLIGSYALRFDTSTKIASQLLHLQTDGFDVDQLDERNRRIAAATMEDAKRAAKRLFGDASLLVAVAGRPVGM